MKGPTISVVLIVKNEEHNIEDFFTTIQGIADELVVVDTGSTDGTLKEVRHHAQTAPFPVKVLEFIQDLFHDGQTRQYGTEHAACEYIFQVDADERLSKGYRERLKTFLADKKPEVVTLPRIDELVPHLNDIMDYRLYKREANVVYGADRESAVHPHLHFSAAPVFFDEPLYHMQGKNHWLRRPNRIFDQLSREIDRTENTAGFFKEYIRGVLSFFYKFRKVYFRLGTYKDGSAGFKFAFLKGFYTFLFHVMVGLKPRVKSNGQGNH